MPKFASRCTMSFDMNNQIISKAPSWDQITPHLSYELSLPSISFCSPHKSTNFPCQVLFQTLNIPNIPRHVQLTNSI